MRTKKIFLNMVCDILPYLLIGIVGLVKMNVLITYIGDVGNGYYQTINQIISYVFWHKLVFLMLLYIVYINLLQRRIRMILMLYMVGLEKYLR